MPEYHIPGITSGFHLYTDGSATKQVRKIVVAGWSFALSGDGPIPDDEASFLFAVWVQLWYVQAASITLELQAEQTT